MPSSGTLWATAYSAPRKMVPSPPRTSTSSTAGIDESVDEKAFMFASLNLEIIVSEAFLASARAELTKISTLR